MSAGCPYRCTGRTARVRGVTAAATASASSVRRTRIDIGEDRTRAGHVDGQGGIGGRERRGDHLVAGPDAQPAQRQRDRVGAGVHADGVCRAGGGGELGFEGRHFRAEHEPSAIEHAGDRRVDGLAIVAGPQHVEGDPDRSAVTTSPRGHVDRDRGRQARRSRRSGRGRRPASARAPRAAAPPGPAGGGLELRGVGVEAADVDRLLLGWPLDEPVRRPLRPARPAAPPDRRGVQCSLPPTLKTSPLHRVGGAGAQERVGDVVDVDEVANLRAVAEDLDFAAVSSASRMNQPMKPWRLWRMSCRGP